MQAVEKKQNQAVIFQKIGFETIDAITCFQIREKLDAIFGGNSPLEETPTSIKRILFGHLETCSKCCRSFDVRLRFR